MNHPPHIAFFIPNLEVGGAQRVTVDLANGLAGEGYRVDLVCPFLRGGFLEDVSEPVNVVDLDVREIRALGILGSIPSLRQYLTRHEPDVLFSEMTYANVVAIVSSRLTRSETVLVPTEHLSFGSNTALRSRGTDLLARQLYRYVDHLVAVSRGVGDSVIEATHVRESAVRVIHNPVPIRDIRTRSKEPIDHPWFEEEGLEPLVTVGRLAPQKDIPTLLRAFEQVSASRAEARLIVAGGGPHREELIETARSRGLEEIVSFPGYVENPYAYMARSSAFVLSSRYEGLPTVLIEALACGCRIVSTDCPHGPTEILEGGRYGTLVPVADPDGLAEGILETLTAGVNPERQWRRAEDFSLEAIVSAYGSFTDEILGLA